MSGLVEIAGHLLSSASQSRQQASLEARERAAQLAMERLACASDATPVAEATVEGALDQHLQHDDVLEQNAVSTTMESSCSLWLTPMVQMADDESRDCGGGGAISSAPASTEAADDQATSMQKTCLSPRADARGATHFSAALEAGRTAAAAAITCFGPSPLLGQQRLTDTPPYRVSHTYTTDA